MCYLFAYSTNGGKKINVPCTLATAVGVRVYVDMVYTDTMQVLCRVPESTAVGCRGCPTSSDATMRLLLVKVEVPCRRVRADVRHLSTANRF